MDRHEDARRLHSELDLVGLRAQATAVGLVQLCAELQQAGVLSDAGIGRIKAAIADQILVSYKPRRGRDTFEQSLKRRLDSLFPVAAQGGTRPAEVGTSDELRARLDLDANGD